MRRTRGRFDVALHAPYASPLYLRDHREVAGGAELQAQRIAKALAGAGFRVCHIVYAAPGLPKSVDGVTLVQQAPPGRTPLHTLRDCVHALRRAESLVYVERGAGWETGAVGAVARSRGRPFIFSSSSDSDFSGERLTNRRERTLFGLGTRLTSATVVQSAEQRRLARKHRPSMQRIEVIPSFGPPIPTKTSPALRDRFLWIGRLDDNKQPVIFLELAERLPEARFSMVVTARSRGPEELAEEITRRAAGLLNVELLSPRPREELTQLYARSVALINTSQIEGFPNTFLEALAAGTPVLSLNVDPDRAIANHGLGVVAGGSLENLALAARRAWADRLTNGYESVARDYVNRFHAPDEVGRQWTTLVGSLISSAGSERRI